MQESSFGADAAPDDVFEVARAVVGDIVLVGVAIAGSRHEDGGGDDQVAAGVEGVLEPG